MDSAKCLNGLGKSFCKKKWGAHPNFLGFLGFFYQIGLFIPSNWLNTAIS